MAGVRGRGFSTGKALSILFRIVADGSQARREIGKTSQEATQQIRSVETLLQRALSVISRPVRSRLGLGGALGISLLRENLRGLAANEINKVKEGLGETEKAAKKASKATTGAAASITSASAALIAIRGKDAAVAIQEVAKGYSDTTFAIQAFDEVLERSMGKTKQVIFGTQAATGNQLKSILSSLGVKGNKPFGETGFTFRNKDSEEALAEFQKGFNELRSPVMRAAVAADVFGDKSAKMLPILEATREEFKKESAEISKYREVANKLAEVENARAISEAANLELIKLKEQALKDEAKAVQTLLDVERARQQMAQDRIVQTGRAEFGRPRFGAEGGEKVAENIPKLTEIQKQYTDAQAQSILLTRLHADAQQKVLDLQHDIVFLAQEHAKANTEVFLKDSLHRKALEELVVLEQRAKDIQQDRLDDIDRATDLANIASGRGPVSPGFAKREAADELILAQAIEKRAEADALGTSALRAAAAEIEANDLLIEARSRLTEVEIDTTGRAKLAQEAKNKADKLKEEFDLRQIGRSATLETLAKNEETAEAAKATAKASANAVEKAGEEAAEKAAKFAAVRTANFGKLASQTKLTTAEVALLNKVLAQTGSKGGVDNVLKVIQSLRSFRAGPSGGGVGAIVPDDPQAIANIESFVKNLVGITSQSEKASVAIEAAGVATAEKLLPALEATVPATTEATTALAGLGATLGPVGIGIGLAAAAGVALTVVLFMIAKRTAEADIVIARAAEKTGILAENLSVLDLAAKRAGLGGLKTVQEKIGSFERILGQVARGELPETAFMFRKFGIDAQTGSKDVNESLIKIVNGFNSLEDPGQRAVLMQRAFEDRTGKVGLALKAVGPDFVKYREHLTNTGRILTTEGAEATLQFNRQLDEVKRTLEAMALAFGRPIIELGGFQIASRAASTEVRGLGTLIGGFGKLAGIFVLGVGGITASLVGLIKTFSQVGTALSLDAFMDLWAQNIADIIAGNEKIQKSEEELQLEIDETLKKEELRGQTIVQLKEQERDARARIEQQITDNFKRQVELRTGTRAEAAAQERLQISADAQAQLDVVMADWKREETRTTDGTKEANEKKQANLIGFSNKVTAILLEHQNKDANILAQEQIRIREDEEQFQDDRIAAQRAWADVRIDVLRDEAERSVDNRAAKLEEIRVIEQAQTKMEMDEITRRQGLAGRDSAIIRKLANDRLQKQAQSQQQENQRTREIAEAGFAVRRRDLQLFNARVATAIIDNQTHIDALRDAAARRNVTRANQPSTIYATKDVEAAKAAVSALEVEIRNLDGAFKDSTKAHYDLSIAKADLAAKEKTLDAALAAEAVPITLVKSLQEAHAARLREFQDKIESKKRDRKILQDEGKDTKLASEEIEQIESEKVAAIQQYGREIRDAYLTQAQDIRDIMEDTNNILRNARQTQIQIDLDNINRIRQSNATSVAQKVLAVQQELTINKNAENLQHEANLEGIKNRQAAALESALTDEEWLEKEEAFHAEREAEMRRHNTEMGNLTKDAIKDERRTKLEGSGFEQGMQGGGFDLMSKMKENLVETGEASISMGDMMNVGFGVAGQAVAGLADGVGQMVQNWVLMGKTGPAAMKKVVASVLAGVSAQATTQAIMFTAYGIAALTPWGSAIYGPAAPWFKAAALMGAVAIGTGLLGRAVAGDSFAEQSAEKPAKEEDIKNEIKRDNEGRRQFVEHIHRVVVTGERGFVAKQLAEEVRNNNPEVRRAINTAAK